MIKGKTFTFRFSRQARKDIEKLTPALWKKLKDILIEVLASDPYQGKKLLGDLAGHFSYRLSYQDRIVYMIDEKQNIIFIERARTHYGD
ncbi:MAG: type II toxin-antitoxin system RelE/ParE family toxin [Candidatus Omnitrophica bacterium]|nr:type II toxin-antitoxin system RelE/ParE family toxin [Candidatus Omnitrophota bacterium]